MAEITVEPAELSKEAQPGIEQILHSIDKNSKSPKLVDAWRFRQEVMAKYQLPEPGLRVTNPAGYIDIMEKLLKERGVQIRDKHEFIPFFEENPEAGAVALEPNVFRDNTVVISTANGNDLKRLRARAADLAHEAVHALQHIYYPRMPARETEKEAYYYSSLTPQLIEKYKNDPDFLQTALKTLEENIDISVRTDQRINGEVNSSQ